MTDHQGLPIRRRVLAVVAMSLGSMMLMIDAAVSSVVLPTIADELNVRGSATLLVVTVYQLTLAMTLLPLAALGDRFGYRPLYQAGFALHCVAGFLCLRVETLQGLILVRCLQSLGAATAMSVAVAMLRNIYPSDRLGSGLALNTIFNASGTALAPVVGGLVITFAPWQWAFAAVIPLTLVSLAFSRNLPDPEPRKHHPFDLRGAALCAATFGLLIAGLEAAVHTPYLGAALSAIAVGVGAGWLLVRHEKREARPVLPVDLLANRALGLTTLATFMGTVASMVVILYLPFRLQHGFGFSPGEIGGMMTAYAIASVMFAPVAGVLSDRVPVPLLCTGGSLFGAMGIATFAFLPEDPGKLDIAFRLWLCGAGFGFFFSPNARFLVGSAPRERAAAAGSLFTTSRMIAMAISATLVASLLAMDLGEGPVPAIVAAALAAATGLLSATGIRFRKRRRRTPPGPEESSRL